MVFFLIDSLEQGSEEWKEWRRGVIGASEAPTIMGENPFETANKLKLEKLGRIPAFQGNAATREGQRLEPVARRILEKRFGSLRPVVVQDGELPFLAASLDGMTHDHDRVVEIKCGAKAYAMLADRKRIPDYYRAQLQHILMITGLDEITYSAYRPRQPVRIMTVSRDDRYIRRMRRTEMNFMDDLISHGHPFQRVFRGRKVGP